VTNVILSQTNTLLAPVLETARHNELNGNLIRFALLNWFAYRIDYLQL